jgi:LmbE family N-acetylglucosaminyl deacetylase
MLSRYDFVYLSPHFDDAAFSCGGQIHSHAQNGKSVLIVTVMAGEPTDNLVSDYARGLHERWQLHNDTVAMRSAEDVEACRILGADHMHLKAPDCIYRVHPETDQPLYSVRPEIFGDVHPADRGLVKELSGLIAELPACDRLYVPLTVGNHVDHQITRMAAERSNRTKLLFYEDYPYAREPGALQAVIGTGNVGWLPIVMPLKEEDLRAKVDAFMAYRSQVGTFFADKSDLETQVNEYSKKVGGERVWQATTG